jgi:hypothetical protein
MDAFEYGSPQRRDRAAHRRRQPHTYFVGRRPYEAAEVYAVTERDVQRLHRDRRDGPLSLDWRGQDGRALEVSRVLLARVAHITPRREVAEQFALSILAGLPEDGFVLDSDEIWRWLQNAGYPHDALPEPRGRPWFLRLGDALRRTGTR